MDVPAGPAEARPSAVDLLVALCGLFTDPDIGGMTGEELPAAIALEVLPQLGISPNGTRMALARQVDRGFLEKTRSGRQAAYRVTAAGMQILSEDGFRVRARSPFAPSAAVWTLASFTVPEQHRDLRTRLRQHLVQCGFRSLRDGLWVALDAFSAELLTRRLDARTIELSKLDLFVATSHLSTGLAELIDREWNTDELREEHERFLARWEGLEIAPFAALPTLTLLSAEWVDLLKKDPGVPSARRAADWPGDRSAATAWRLYQTFRSDAAERLRRLRAQHVEGVAS